jgi:chromosome segregation ATPase
LTDDDNSNELKQKETIMPNESAPLSARDALALATAGPLTSLVRALTAAKDVLVAADAAETGKMSLTSEIRSLTGQRDGLRREIESLKAVHTETQAKLDQALAAKQASHAEAMAALQRQREEAEAGARSASARLMALQADYNKLLKTAGVA